MINASNKRKLTDIISEIQARGLDLPEDVKQSLLGVKPKIIWPVNEYGCFTKKDGTSFMAYQNALWVHGPVSNGYCIVCHAPHASPESYLLLKKPDELCAECHKAGQIFNKAMHKDRADCTACHNPHVGKDSRLLKVEHAEAW